MERVKRSAMLDLGRVVTSWVDAQNKGSCQSNEKKPEAEVKIQNSFFILENLPGPRVYRRERGPGPSVTAGVPFENSHAFEKTKSQI